MGGLGVQEALRRGGRYGRTHAMKIEGGNTGCVKA